MATPCSESGRFSCLDSDAYSGTAIHVGTEEADGSTAWDGGFTIGSDVSASRYIEGVRLSGVDDPVLGGSVSWTWTISEEGVRWVEDLDFCTEVWAPGAAPVASCVDGAHPTQVGQDWVGHLEASAVPWW